MINEIANLPDVSFIDNMTLEDVQEQMVRDYCDRYKELTGKDITLSRADPIALILYALSVQAYQALLYVDRSGKQDLLKYSYGEYLDNLAAHKGITREPAKPSRTTVRFTLSGIRPEPVGIPAGSRVTDGEIYFETDEYREIPAGSESVEIPCTCIEAGTNGNGVMVGGVNILVDPIPYMASVSNIDEPAGGTDIESDESLVDRIYISPSKYSVAGPEEAYVYWTKTFNSSIEDVYVDSDEPMEVKIEFIMEGGELPSESVVRALEDFLANENIRPLSDHVTVAAPQTVAYDIGLKYFVNRSDVSKASTIQSSVTAAVEEYIQWQRSKIGRDINPSELIRRVMAAGAKRVEITKPIYQVIGKANVAALNTKSVTYGGVEDD